ncbi:cobalt-precorrin-6A reductase [Devosia sp. YIM 151766]|uniref:cobalt-precorrin-6A reductase n=1 Tax=Devosia sp. YIM 151766 TaxID=3017325 RepID=UPI00255C3350|nr:cobalt-precorrin-6A reductase [Devosia sp. YIM 151766]WIY53437.1 cobalt-precorrin-6A reductase [Devosia sp. YIM 151766]
MNILILGGTVEARQLAGRLVTLGHKVTTSLAGRTQDPILPEGALRIGPFGGIAGLSAYLQAAGIERLVDASHPFADQISGNAVAASKKTGIRLVRLTRPGWEPPAGQSWIMAASVQEAAAALPAGAVVLLTTGHSGLETYLQRQDCSFLVRVIEAPAFELPGHAQLLRTRPPYTLGDEIALMRNHGVTHLVSKNSGGVQTRAKLDAAQQAGVQVVMIARPLHAPALEVDSVEAALSALELVTA